MPAADGRQVLPGVETEMVIYPDEGHPVKQLPHMENVLQRVLDWFAKHDIAQP
jgi:dipeptidyl aminopeptidase/acylaminoacyl peptidase